ncbi:MAG: BON domain-containing protein [Planctomycetota bacterium]
MNPAHPRDHDSDDGEVHSSPRKRRQMQDVQESEVTLAALAALAQSSVSELRFLRVDENDDALHLTGRVQSFYHKQLAQETLRGVAKGRRVVNSVDVGSSANG